MQFALELQIVGRIGKDQIDRRFGKRLHDLDAIARKNTVQRKRFCALSVFHRYCLCPGAFGALVRCEQDESKAIRGQILF